MTKIETLRKAYLKADKEFKMCLDNYYEKEIAYVVRKNIEEMSLQDYTNVHEDLETLREACDMAEKKRKEALELWQRHDEEAMEELLEMMKS